MILPITNLNDNNLYEIAYAKKSKKSTSTSSSRNSGLYVNVDELRTIPVSLEQKRAEIMLIYNNQIRQLLEESKQAIAVSGVQYSEIINQFQYAFNTLSNEINNLINALQIQISRYDNLNSSVNNAMKFERNDI